MKDHAPAPATPFLAIGGDDGLRTLVRRFYELMDTQPESFAIRKMHPADLDSSEEKLFMYLSGWLGGPQRYVEKFGHPRLRARHLPFAIGRAERDQWMMCMRQALQEVVVDVELRSRLETALASLADHMRNQSDSS